MAKAGHCVAQFSAGRKGDFAKPGQELLVLQPTIRTGLNMGRDLGRKLRRQRPVMKGLEVLRRSGALDRSVEVG